MARHASCQIAPVWGLDCSNIGPFAFCSPGSLSSDGPALFRRGDRLGGVGGAAGVCWFADRRNQRKGPRLARHPSASAGAGRWREVGTSVNANGSGALEEHRPLSRGLAGDWTATKPEALVGSSSRRSNRSRSHGRYRIHTQSSQQASKSASQQAAPRSPCRTRSQ